ncbi:SRPBCC domain-containing protein [Nitrospirillum sp. BR 11163]|uniref:SRPBCC family protein n=1 Tax=Nitrospirillum sp. BR 11163 TaxID=3104323 RepID=UPI002AFE7E32|nr:SRPBCC domain-containing protein [Nitrospirillum sp. BR 11163]MEA1676384.1 SRPBCC domain-containing protein [Nitrospirillum sp. BR 11163]
MTETPQFRLSRRFAATPCLLWSAYTEPERLRLWWGPKGFSWVRGDLDLRPGGSFFYGMKPPAGTGDFTMWGKWTFREIIAPKPPQSPGTLSFLVSFTDADGQPVRHPMSPTWPLEVLSTTAFVADGGATRLDCAAVPVNATAEEEATFAAGMESMRQGWGGTLDQLDGYLARAQATA